MFMNPCTGRTRRTRVSSPACRSSAPRETPGVSPLMLLSGNSGSRVRTPYGRRHQNLSRTEAAGSHRPLPAPTGAAQRLHSARAAGAAPSAHQASRATEETCRERIHPRRTGQGQHELPTGSSGPRGRERPEFLAGKPNASRAGYIAQPRGLPGDSPAAPAAGLLGFPLACDESPHRRRDRGYRRSGPREPGGPRSGSATDWRLVLRIRPAAAPSRRPLPEAGRP
jgi:hypothetical protein